MKMKVRFSAVLQRLFHSLLDDRQTAIKEGRRDEKKRWRKRKMFVCAFVLCHCVRVRVRIDNDQIPDGSSLVKQTPVNHNVILLI